MVVVVDYTCYQAYHPNWFGYMYWKSNPLDSYVNRGIGFGFHHGLLYSPLAPRIKMILHVIFGTGPNPSPLPELLSSVSEFASPPPLDLVPSCTFSATLLL